MSGRGSQFDDGQFFRGKNDDTASPRGPALVVEIDGIGCLHDLVVSA